MKLIFVACAVVTLAVMTNGWSLDQEKIKCIQEVTEKLVEQNPDLKSWMDEMRQKADDYKIGADKCNESRGLKKTLCIARLKLSAFNEFRKMVNKLSGEHKGNAKQLKQDVLNCLKL